MRTTTRILVTGMCVVALAGCASAEPPAQEPGSTVTDPSPTASPSPSASPSTPAPVADVPPEVMLPATAWENLGPDAAREESVGVLEWRVPEACAAGSPATAVAMRTVQTGTGEVESSFGVHQVAVLADADAAVAEMDRLAAALAGCTPTPPGDPTVYVAEPLAVGAQGIGLATVYYPPPEGSSIDDAMGTYLTVTRRGNAVSLVGLHSGEGRVGVARQTVVPGAQAAWELLCSYDSAGC
ncbi:hypothetical protein [Cellulomonas fengjieae]|uniref:hypothetical protein n=1 Tax=Cellulomonas fengjieae TaxID=2819978 RepID=UPI001AAEA401|nr:hypothetical protein [Cellulomonas fengjieae]MBO3100558.1 hypothetical protein [Cellulomonas fengjieae]